MRGDLSRESEKTGGLDGMDCMMLLLRPYTVYILINYLTLGRQETLPTYPTYLTIIKFIVTSSVFGAV